MPGPFEATGNEYQRAMEQERKSNVTPDAFCLNIENVKKIREDRLSVLRGLRRKEGTPTQNDSSKNCGFQAEGIFVSGAGV